MYGINSKAPRLKDLQASYEPADTGETVAISRSGLARTVYCILGLPIDAINLTSLVQEIEAAAALRDVLLISTPNLNFLVSSLSDSEFRESLLSSNVCPPDGAPIIWIARLLGLPIKERATGADLLELLQARAMNARRITTFLFGGAEGIAAAAASRINARSSSVRCVGALNPGFCDISEMSQEHIIEAVNSSGADFLVVSLGAQKGQLWLHRNHNRLTIPVRSHLGAAINFQAGAIRRAPRLFRVWGMEWLWRIKEEHYLWKRYRHDGFVLLRLLLSRVLPLAIIAHYQRVRWKQQDLTYRETHNDQLIKVSLSGAALERHVPDVIPRFEAALVRNKDIILDLSDTIQIDARFLGLLLMLRNELKSRGKTLTFGAVPRAIERIMRLHELGFLLNPTSCKTGQHRA